MSFAQTSMKMVTSFLKPLDNKVVGTTVRVALILYASLIAPELPEVVARQFDNLAVRSVLIFLIAYLAIKDPVTAAYATLALMVTIMSLNRREVQDVIGGAVDLAEDAVEGAVDIVGDVVEGVVGTTRKMMGFDMKPVEEAKEMAVPTGVESDMMAGSV